MISLILRVFPTISWLCSGVSLIYVARRKDKWIKGGLSDVVIYMFNTSDSIPVRLRCEVQPISPHTTCLSALEHRNQEENQWEMVTSGGPGRDLFTVQRHCFKAVAAGEKNPGSQGSFYMILLKTSLLTCCPKRYEQSSRSSMWTGLPHFLLWHKCLHGSS